MVSSIGALRWGNSYPAGSGYDRYAYVDVSIGDAAKAATQPGTSLVYTSGTSVRDNWGSINTGVPLSEARANGWLLTTASGASVMNVQYGAYVPDFGSSAYQQRWIQNVTGFLAQTGADGVHIDDVLADAGSFTGGVYPAKYPTQQAWEDAQVSFVSAVSAALRARGYYVLVQASGRRTTATGYANDSAQTEKAFFSRLAPLVDGVMSEYWMETPADKVNPKLRTSGTSDWDQHWDEWLDLINTVQDNGADFFTLMYGSSSTSAGVAAMRYARASFLLEWNGGGGAVDFKPDGGTTDPWNLEWTADVGQPVGTKYRVGVGWRRDFTAGTAIVNPDQSASQTFALAGSYLKADGSSVSTVTLGPAQALVLRGTGTPVAARPVSAVAPVLSGVAQEGSVLSSSTGSWTGSPTTYAYQWQRCDGTGSSCASIAGATSSRLQLETAVVGGTVRAVVTASNSAGSASARSNASSVIVPAAAASPVNSGAPQLSGVAQVGAVLSTSTGSWTGSPTTYAYQWQRCDAAGSACASVAGATSSRLQLGSSDAGRTVRVLVTAWNTAGSASARSDASAVVAPQAVTSTSPTSFSVSSSIGDGASLTTPVVWEASVSGASASRVEFWVDGALKWTERVVPYLFGGAAGRLDPASLSAGTHRLTLKAYTSDSSMAEWSGVVTVAAPAPAAPPPPAPAPAAPPASSAPFVVTSTISDGDKVRGTVVWKAQVSGGDADHVEFWIDGKLTWTERSAPYGFQGDGGSFDSTTLDRGHDHVLVVKAYSTDGRTSSVEARVKVLGGD
jgi:hypothetical protein